MVPSPPYLSILHIHTSLPYSLLWGRLVLIDTYKGKLVAFKGSELGPFYFLPYMEIKNPGLALDRPPLGSPAMRSGPGLVVES
jgi:hypothetical protein